MQEDKNLNIIIISLLAGILLISANIFIHSHFSARVKTPTPIYVEDIEWMREQVVKRLEAETAGWQTYRNEKYGFEMKYPADWDIRDDSFVRNGQAYPLLHMTSPDKFNLLKDKNIAVHYLIQISVDPISKEITSVADFGTSQPNGGQPPWNAGIDKKIVESTEEYKIGQQILSTFKFIQ